MVICRISLISLVSEYEGESFPVIFFAAGLIQTVVMVLQEHVGIHHQERLFTSR